MLYFVSIYNNGLDRIITTSCNSALWGQSGHTLDGTGGTTDKAYKAQLYKILYIAILGGTGLTWVLKDIYHW